MLLLALSLLGQYVSIVLVDFVLGTLRGCEGPLGLAGMRASPLIARGLWEAGGSAPK